MKYFPPSKNAKYRSEINNFQQFVGESVSESWERFKRLMQKYLYQGIPRCIQIKTYYNGLDDATRLVIDASANGALLAKPYAEAFNILERISSNNQSWSDPRAIHGKGSKGFNESESFTALNLKIENLTDLVMRSMTHQSTVGASAGKANVSHIQGISCSFCVGEYRYNNCPGNPESVHYLGNAQNNENNPYSIRTTWAGGTILTLVRVEIRKETMLKYMENNDTTVQSQAVSLRNLEMQVGQLATDLKSKPKGVLPSDIKVPKRDGKEQCNALTLRSGKTLPTAHPNAQGIRKELNQDERSGL
ncbi:uncharacterized protein LOC111025500 [Momordica charantia]|uniref:Uncharacterized protein LOC111025500 n=1 Tax=Momordica charantia TaxID=3673 RepID=A0A6J1DXK5_MOMCH|nr:uncharacterized protein LOC111025500 [Momordica charantia]